MKETVDALYCRKASRNKHCDQLLDFVSDFQFLWCLVSDFWSGYGALFAYYLFIFVFMFVSFSSCVLVAIDNC